MAPRWYATCAGAPTARPAGSKPVFASVSTAFFVSSKAVLRSSWSFFHVGSVTETTLQLCAQSCGVRSPFM